MGGLTIGVFWGAVVSVVGLAALSLSSPLPPRGGAEAVEAALTGPAAEAVAEDAVAAAAAEAAALEEAAGDAYDVSTAADSGGGAPEAEGEAGAEVSAEPVAEPAADPTAEPAAEPATDPTAEAPVETEAEEAAPPATEIPLPSGSEFNRPPPEPEAALPVPDAAPTAVAPQAPVLAANVVAPSFDTSPAAQPSVGATAPVQIAAVAGDLTAPARPATVPAPVLAGGPTALTQPEASAAPEVRTALLPQVAPAAETGAVEDAVASGAAEPETAEAEAIAAVEVPAVVAPQAPDPEAVPLATPVFPTIGDGSETASLTPVMPNDIASEGVMAAASAAPATEAAGLSTPAFPQTSGLPQVAPAVGAGIGVQVGEETAAAEGPDASERGAEDIGDLPAILAFAAPFDTADERPVMSVILIDEPDSRIELETLTRFTFPVAFAIAPNGPDAAARAAAYRAAGFEVVMMGSMIPPDATAADVEVALTAAASTLPEAVAVLDTPEGRIQTDRPVLDAMVAALSESGHGLVAFPRGLNAAEQSASRADVPAATVFRFLDDRDQRATEITRFLSRAAFAAAQEGSVIVVGRTRPDTVTALFSWALSGRSEAIALAPLSANLLRNAAP